MPDSMMATDAFPNILTKKLTMSAANTLTFEELDVGLNLFDKAALIIQRLEYFIFNSTYQEMTTSGDQVNVALSTSDTIVDLDPNQTEIVDSYATTRQDLGTAGSGVYQPLFTIRDFSGLVGGGILIAPKPLHFAMSTTGLANPGNCTFRMYFRLLRLKDAQYLELLQTRNQFG